MIPEFLIELLEKQYGTTLANNILEGYKQKRMPTLRVNTIKSNIVNIKEELTKANITFEEVPWNKDALIITNADENEISKLDIYTNGEIYFQSLSSMLPPIVLNPQQGENILDMAAAPGSKTTQIAALTNNNCMITACEMNKIRAERLKYNLEKQGVSGAVVMTVDARNLDDFFSFDKILLDAPCSGSGTLYEKNSKIESTFTPKLIQKSCKTQLALLKKAIKLLKPGHEMIYSTCSILQCENEDILQKIPKEANVEIMPINIDSQDIPLLPTKIQGTLCICPNNLFEGFFVAKIRKR